ncbi:glycosyl hydrolase family 17 [bacterium]|nr:glycosyl hydrolase family 17 [bacterium]
MTSRLGVIALVFVILGGCFGAHTDSAPREEPFEVRTFETQIDNRWIGNAVCYGPHRDGQRPGGPSPTAEQIREDIGLMLEHWTLIRLYGSTGVAETILSIIHDDALGMKVMLGVWVAPDDSVANRREVEAGIRLANAYAGIVVAVSVGNETQIDWSAHRSPVEGLIEHVRRVRAGVAVPVTVADDFNYWNKPESQALAAELDFITMHAHPLWNGLQLDDAMAWLLGQVSDVRGLHADRLVVLGETGWATSVHDEGEQARLIKGRPGELEQKRFYESVRAWARDERFTVFFFEAFDENWKGGASPVEVEKHWGVYRADRSAKAAVATER